MAEKLNREVIARAALRLLESAGVDGITLRALAAELGVRAPTLYWHVKSKQDIFKAMAVAISEDAAEAVAAMNSEAPWRDRLKNWASAVRSSILSHRDGGRVFAGTFTPDPATFKITEAALAAWQDAGLSVEASAQRMILLRHFVVGFCIEEQELAGTAERGAPTDHTGSPDVDPRDFPLTAQALPALATGSADERFELGLRLLLQLAPVAMPASAPSVENVLSSNT